MAEITIRNLDDFLLVRLKRKAWENGLPLEESLRRMIIAALEIEEVQGGDFFVPQTRRSDRFVELARTPGHFDS